MGSRTAVRAAGGRQGSGSAENHTKPRRSSDRIGVRDLGCGISNLGSRDLGFGSSRNALIGGAGIGGLSAGLALQRAGWHVRLFEQAATPRELGFALRLA